MTEPMSESLWTSILHRNQQTLADRSAAGLAHPEWDRDALIGEVKRLRAHDARIHEELRDRRSDDLNVRGLLSPQPGTGTKHVPGELGPTIAPAVEWLVAEVERLTIELAQLRADVAEEQP